jgi:hypothetical protein
MSPSVILANTLTHTRTPPLTGDSHPPPPATPSGGGPDTAGAATPLYDFYAAECFSLSGEAIAHRIGRYGMRG